MDEEDSLSQDNLSSADEKKEKSPKKKVAEDDSDEDSFFSASSKQDLKPAKPNKLKPQENQPDKLISDKIQEKPETSPAKPPICLPSSSSKTPLRLVDATHTKPHPTPSKIVEEPKPRSSTGGKSLINIMKQLKKPLYKGCNVTSSTINPMSRRQLLKHMSEVTKSISDHLDRNTPVRLSFQSKPKPLVRPKIALTDMMDRGFDEDEVLEPEREYQPRLIKGGVLEEHQIVGLNWMIGLWRCGVNGMLADQMGLGKTIQTISFLAYLREVEGISKTHLIVVPLSVVHNWKKEFNKWFPDCKVETFSAIKKEKSHNLRVLNSDVRISLTSRMQMF